MPRPQTSGAVLDKIKGSEHDEADDGLVRDDAVGRRGASRDRHGDGAGEVALLEPVAPHPRGAAPLEAEPHDGLGRQGQGGEAAVDSGVECHAA